MKKNRLILLAAALVLLPAASLSGAGGGEDAEFRIYYPDSTETMLTSSVYTRGDVSDADYIGTVCGRLNAGRSEEELFLPEGVIVEDAVLGEDGLLRVTFNEAYRDLGISREILVRAAVVKTFMQIGSVAAVEIYVGGNELTNVKGEPVGPLTADSFVELTNSDKDAYRYETFVLYFTDQDGKSLLPETRRIYYRRSIPKERVALEQLAKGPIEEGHYPTIPPGTELLGITVSDGACYVDFDRNFINQAIDGLDPEIAVYSVTHTVVENTDANRVEIQIDGEGEVMFGEDLDLYQFFQWNDDLTPGEEETE